MFGGADTDYFYFQNLTDSAVGAARDVIRDFSHAELDRIGLQNVYSGTLTFAGYVAFSNTAGEVIVQHTGTPGTDIVRIDIDGIGGSDMDIEVVTAVDLVSGDFFL